jgi:hypothetical protein
MTMEVFEMTTKGGASDFSEILRICEALGPYCLIGGLTVNCYVEPVYTLDADFVLVQESLSDLPRHLSEAGFRVDEFTHSISAQRNPSELRPVHDR